MASARVKLRELDPDQLLYEGTKGGGGGTGPLLQTSLQSLDRLAVLGKRQSEAALTVRA